ncbi:MAG: hypothetical protein JNL90_16395 [Planctomycetes bacterium]|nr:hypothetical protein [Planctomycetota bacterium]
MNDPHDDPLFDPALPADAELGALERRFAPLRERPLPPLPPLTDAAPEGVAPRLRLLRGGRAAAAAVLLLAAAAGAWRLSIGAGGAAGGGASGGDASGGASEREPRAPVASAVEGAALDVSLARRDGAVRVEPAAGGAARDGTDPDALQLGDRIVCEPGGGARVRVGAIGWLELAERTELRVAAGHGDRTREGGWHLELERGTVDATIFAAPRVFALGTPAGIAVDLGCIYRTTVDGEGRVFLSVVAGSVSFESGGRKVHVPAGAGCRAWPMVGPGVPSWDDDAPELKELLRLYDESRLCGDGVTAEERIEQLLALLGPKPAPRASLSLWHLLAGLAPDAPPALRTQLADRLAALVPPPEKAPLERCRSGDAEALAEWREALELHW